MSFLFSSGVRNVIPDAGLLHRYDWSHSSTTTSTVPDLEGSDDLTGGFTSLSVNINGVQAGEFDATDDIVTGQFFTILSGAYWVFVVIQRQTSTTNGEGHIDNYDGSLDGLSFQFYSEGSNWNLYQGGAEIGGGSKDTNPHIIGIKANTSSEVIRENGTQIASGDAGSGDLDGLGVNRNGDANIYVGEIMVYDPSVSGFSVSDVESHLSDKWGITI